MRQTGLQTDCKNGRSHAGMGPCCLNKQCKPVISDRSRQQTDVTIRIVLGASGACLTGEYYVLLAHHHSLPALRGRFHAALLLSVSCCHGRGVVCTGNRIGTDEQHDT